MTKKKSSRENNFGIFILLMLYAYACDVIFISSSFSYFTSFDTFYAAAALSYHTKSNIKQTKPEKMPKF